jgi:RNA polymerase sigma-70 factor (ECF subfamily)
LFSAIARQEDRAMETLEQRYHARFLAYARTALHHQLRGRIEPEDVAQATWLCVLEGIPKYLRSPGGLSPERWLFCKLREVIIKTHRSFLGTEMRNLMREVSSAGATAGGSGSGSFLSNLAGSQTSPTQKALRNEQSDQVNAVLSQLTEADRDILWRRVVREQPNAEAARELGITEKAASARYMRALDRLQLLLGNREEWQS